MPFENEQQCIDDRMTGYLERVDQILEHNGYPTIGATKNDVMVGGFVAVDLDADPYPDPIFHHHPEILNAMTSPLDVSWDENGPIRIFPNVSQEVSPKSSPHSHYISQ